MKTALTLLVNMTFLLNALYCQSKIQPTIMVIPFAKEGTNILEVYSKDGLQRVAVIKVKEGFDERGVNTIDFNAKLDQINNTSILEEDQLKNIKDEVVQSSGADIYVEVEAKRSLSHSDGNSVSVLMTAYDVFTGESFSNKVANSPMVYTDNFEILTAKAVEQEIDNFLNVIQEKFYGIVENGRTVVVNIGLDPGSTKTLEYENEDGDYISDLIEDWMAANSFKAYYHLKGVTENKMIFDIVKIPLTDENGNNYKLSRFARSLRKYLKTLDIEVDQTINGNQLSLTLKLI